MSDLTAPDHIESNRPTVAQPPRGSSGHQSLASLATVIGLYLAVAVLYWPSSIALNAIWTDTQKETYTHGYLVLLLSLWLLVRVRKRLSAAPTQPAPGALVALALLSAAWLWAWRAAIQEAHLLLVPMLILSAVGAALGWRAVRLTAFPILYLYFALPVWGNINGLVREASSAATAALLWITGVPGYMQGNYIQLPAGTIEIANSCSGLHALIVGLALAALYGEINDDPPRLRILWIAVMGTASLIVNWIRIFMVVIAAYTTDMRSSLVNHHYWLGWWLFAAAFAAFLWWAERRTIKAPQPQVAPKADMPAPGPHPAHLALAFSVLAFLPAASYAMDWTRTGIDREVFISWPTAPAGWAGPLVSKAAQWTPTFTAPSARALRVYADPNGRRVEVFAVVYEVQSQGSKLLGYHNTLLNPSEQLAGPMRIANSRTGRWREVQVVDTTGARSMIWSHDVIGRQVFVDPRLGQLWYGLKAIVRVPLSSEIALRSECIPDCQAAIARLNTAAQNLQPNIR